MSKKWNRFLAFLLAVALVVTTFGSDFASASVYAADEEQEAQEVVEELPEIFEEVEEPEVPEVPAVEEDDEEEVAEDASADDTAVEGSEVVTDPVVAEEVTEATTETSNDEDAAAEASSEEEVVEKADTEGFNKSVEVEGGILVSVSAPAGVLPADAELVVDKVPAIVENKIEDLMEAETNAEEVDTFSYDIKIMFEGQVIQPEDGKVNVEFSNIDFDNSADLAVYHVDDSCNKAEFMTSGNGTDTAIDFDTTHFSVYTIVVKYRTKDLVTNFDFHADTVAITGFSFSGIMFENDFTPLSGKPDKYTVNLSKDDARIGTTHTFSVSKFAPEIQGREFVRAYYWTAFGYMPFDDIKVVTQQCVDGGYTLFAGLYAYGEFLGLFPWQEGKIGDRPIKFAYRKTDETLIDVVYHSYKEGETFTDKVAVKGNQYVNYDVKSYADTKLSAKENEDFDGWVKTPGSTQKVSKLTLNKCSSTVHLYATYKKTTKTVNVKYVALYPTNTTKDLFKVPYEVGKNGLTVSVPDPAHPVTAPEDYEIVGYYQYVSSCYGLGSYKEISSIKLSKDSCDQTVYVKLQKVPVKKVTYIGYVSDGKTADKLSGNLGTAEYKKVKEITVPDATFKLPEKYKDYDVTFYRNVEIKHHFIGGDEIIFEGQYVAPNNKLVFNNCCDEYTIYVLIEKVTYPITYKNDNGKEIETLNAKFGDATPVTTKSFTKATLPAQGYSNDDYEFAGWDDLSTCNVETLSAEQISATKVTGCKTYQAVYKLTKTLGCYQVRYNYPNKVEYSELRYVKVSKNLDADGTKVRVKEPHDTTDQIKNTKYVLVAEDTENSTWEGYVKADNTCKNPLYLDVYFTNPYAGITMKLIAADGEWNYDGQEHKATTAPTVKFVKVVDNEEVEVTTMTGTVIEYAYSKDSVITDPGEKANKISSYKVKVNNTYYSWKLGDRCVSYCGVDILDGVPKCVDGKLVVNAISMEIAIQDASRIYNGQVYTIAEYTESPYFEQDGFSVTLEYALATGCENIKSVAESKVRTDEITATVASVTKSQASAVEAPTTRCFIPMPCPRPEPGTKLTYYVYYNDETPDPEAMKGKGVIIHIINGDLEILKRNVILTSQNRQKEFDGTPLVELDDTSVVASGDGWAKDEGISKFEFTGSQTEVGDSPNSFKFDTETLTKYLIQGTDLDNYNAFTTNATEDTAATVVFGTLLVTPSNDIWVIKARLEDAEDGINFVEEYNGSKFTPDLTVKLHVTIQSSGNGGNDEQAQDENNGEGLNASILDQIGSLLTIKAYAADTIGEQTVSVEIKGKYYNFLVKGYKVSIAENTIHANNYPITMDISGLEIYGLDADGAVVTKNLASYTNAQMAEFDPTPILEGGSPSADDIARNDAAATDVQVSGTQIGSLTINPRPVTIYASNANNNKWTASYKDNDKAANDGFVQATDLTEKDEPVVKFKPRSTAPGKHKNVIEPVTEFKNGYITDYTLSYVNGEYTIPSEDINQNPPENPTTTETPAAPAGAVLGAQRERAAEGAVLGARRGGTEDPTNNAARVIVIVIAAGIAVSIMFFGRKKEDSED